MFTVANILTGFNLLFGVSSIILTFSGKLEWAVLAIIAGALCDFLDGFVARLLKQPSELGKQLDSLADLVTFGVAPGMLVFVLLILSGAWEIILQQNGSLNELWLEGEMGYSVHYWISIFLNDIVGNNAPHLPSHFIGWYKVMPFVALLIPFMSMFRLAKFNLDERQATGFIGLPTPANSLFFASFALLLWSGFGKDNWETALSMTLIKDQVLLTLVLVFSVLLVSELPLFALKFTTFSWKGNQIRFIFLFLCLLMIVVLGVWSVPLIIILYLIMSLVNTKIVGK